jgi:beta-glucuronidase
MIRSFVTHEIRKQFELNSLWEFSTYEGEYKNEVYKVVVPSCWESYPKFSAYRGKARYRNSFQIGGNC